ncbi:MAG: helix-turn-helix domain-containing protein [Segniliparus sp.]|uniref:helix-turn-helix domain-containing protein n=1 Tax=Segniliparus sp. TaxID=2804064 RepID=UPI003F31D559
MALADAQDAGVTGLSVGGSIVGPSRPPVAEGVAGVLDLLAEYGGIEEFETRLAELKETVDPGRWERVQQQGLRIFKLIDSMSQEKARSLALSAIMVELQQCESTATALRALVKHTRLLLNADFAFVSLIDETKGVHTIEVVDGTLTALTPGLVMPWDEKHGLISLYRPGYGPVHSTDYNRDARFLRASAALSAFTAEEVRSLMAMPMYRGATNHGNLFVGSRSPRQFHGEDRALFNTLCVFAGPCLGRLVELEKHTSAAIGVRQRLAEAVAERDSYVESVRWGAEVLEEGLLLHDLDLLARRVGEDFATAVRFATPDGTTMGSYRWPDSGEEEQAGVVHDATTSESGAWVSPLTVGDDYLGTMTLSPLGRDSLGVPRARLESVARTATVVMHLQSHGPAFSVARLQDDLLDDVIDRRQDERLLSLQARRLGVNLSRPHVVVLARPEQGGLDRAALWSSSYIRRLGGLRTTREGHMVLLTPGEDPGAVARAVWEELSKHLKSPVTVSSAGPAETTEAVAQRYKEAQRCLEAMGALGATGTASGADELGFLGVLLSEHQDVEGFARRMLGPIIDYDQERSTELLHTLDVYFSVGASPTRAAKKLHTHTNTVVRRLERVNELLGESWQDMDRLLDVQLALKLWKVRTTLLARKADGPQSAAE